jgi:CRP-like cAMP-binding protein
MLDPVILSATLFGLLSAATLPIGAGIGVLWRPPDRVIAVLLAFGGGALLAALTIDLVAPGVAHGHFNDLALGAIVGGIAFKLLDWLVNRQGGYLRKPSTALTYWRNQARRRLKRVLAQMRRASPLGGLSNAALDQLLSIATVRDIPAGTCLYQAQDPATAVYVILDGRVELTDPADRGRVFEQLTTHDAFGRMSFVTGMPRATEAHTATQVRLLVIPRDAFMAVLPASDQLREAIRLLLASPETERYLMERYGLAAEVAADWCRRSQATLVETGSYAPVPHQLPAVQDPVALLRADERLGFFGTLSNASLGQIAERLVHKAHPAGWRYFHQGQQADRLFLLRRGVVHLVEPNDRVGEPIPVEVGSIFGGFACLTAGKHAVTAVGQGPTEVSELRRDDLDALLDADPELRGQLAAYLGRHKVTAYLTERQHLDARRAAGWAERAARRLHDGGAFPSLAEITRQVAEHKGAAIAMFLGMSLDGIPESFVIGANVLETGTISLSLLTGLILANLPEALSSAAGMKDQGLKVPRILAMWTTLMLMTGIGAGIGALVLEGAPDSLFAWIEGVAAGAMLTMVAETMLPEAFHKGGGVVGLSMLAGFLLAIFFNRL